MNNEELQRIVVAALEDLKAVNLVIKDVSAITDVADLMIFVSGTSSRHVKSLADNVIEKAKAQGVQPLGVEGQGVGDWILVDLGNILVHVMLPEVRNLYDLEKLWSGEIRPE